MGGISVWFGLVQMGAGCKQSVSIYIIYGPSKGRLVYSDNQKSKVFDYVTKQIKLLIE